MQQSRRMAVVVRVDAKHATRRPSVGARTALDEVQRDRAALVRFTRRYTASLEDAEDVVQAASIIALLRPDVTGPTARAWLHVVIRNAALAEHRRRHNAVSSTWRSWNASAARRGPCGCRRPTTTSTRCSTCVLHWVHASPTSAWRSSRAWPAGPTMRSPNACRVRVRRGSTRHPCGGDLARHGEREHPAPAAGVPPPAAATSSSSRTARRPLAPAVPG